MTCAELKQKIKTNTLDKIETLILKYVDNKFVCYQYIDAICKNKNLNKVFIDNIQEIPQGSFIEDSSLYILSVDKIEVPIPLIENLIVLCPEILDKNISYIEIPKLEPWQIEDYLKVLAPEAEESFIKDLCQACNYDIYRLSNEGKKLALFKGNIQKQIIENTIAEGGYRDLSNLTIFNFTTAITKKDFNTMKVIMSDLITHDIEATGCITLLVRSFKSMIDIKFNPKASAESLQLKPNQFYALRSCSNNFTREQLIDIFKFLNQFDYKLKNGELMMADNVDHLTWNNLLVEYLTANLMAI